MITECDKCKHQWNYSGFAIKPTCPSCGLKIKNSCRDLNSIQKKDAAKPLRWESE